MDVTRFVSERGRSLVQTAYLLCGDLELAEDLVQGALISCLPRWDSIEHHSSYVRRAVLNAYLDSRRRAGPGVRLDPAVLDELPSQAWGPERDVECRDTIWRVVKSLSPRERSVVVLRFYEDLDDHEIADLLSLKPSSVRATVTRALTRIRNEQLHLLQDQP